MGAGLGAADDELTELLGDVADVDNELLDGSLDELSELLDVAEPAGNTASAGTDVDAVHQDAPTGYDQELLAQPDEAVPSEVTETLDEANALVDGVVQDSEAAETLPAEPGAVEAQHAHEEDVVSDVSAAVDEAGAVTEETVAAAADSLVS
ncbi:hypothetical protein RIF23_08225 [Lipingzhangella sp. LS1_29]|uniref:Uncharacterized protein n=1 Tax=Lipingzhangella rawalii TaxID=2055835 RepID=A0ABU2H4Q6_9ACTN|nr:hypothetical protein [Lipingzhangella rawalii]MDS1270278.1 hypothetical protein [Lipingzhangella rawalii]